MNSGNTFTARLCCICDYPGGCGGKKKFTARHCTFCDRLKVASTRTLEVLQASIEETGVPALKTAAVQRQAHIRTMLDGVQCLIPRMEAKRRN
ncbi:hypothetical protein LA635_p1043 (plasmid) [Erwinia amylovora LA635]|uniref:Uncharacterized protein n=1 Tax=Erwinia amylovora TaxID=552 RepID=A0A0P0ZH10_ERWAM|nr:hypothetical protein LA635_p1043 [Erwinia amylovora LA635]CDK23819.1 hypothetical protein LA636_p1041 [Erwinia amylovora LA636]CDK23870.1 hypothetical protein LA637_p1043 [Erwinia amylovora LA637]CDM08168.1 hypothetical protein EAMY692_p20042 [Erwinia amylovora]